MLKHIPFYASLLGREMSNNKKSNNGMVLVYGAIEVHAMGDKGCIASNGRIAQETGLSTGTVANYISEMNRSGWVKVNTKTVNGGIVRLNIEPLLTIQPPSSKSDALNTSVIPPSSADDTPLHTSVNIGNSTGNKENTSLPKGKGETPGTYGNTEINEMFEYWQSTVGYEISGRRQANRNACNNLIKKHTADGVRKLIQGVVLAQGDRYAPQIADFEELQSKLSKLMAWGKKNTQKVTVY